MEYTSINTGNLITINCAPAKTVKRLKAVILKELKATPLGLKLLGENSLLEREIDFMGVIDFIKNTLIAIDISEEFENALFECLKFCTYKTVYKIDEALFDNEKVPEAREDYYEIMWYCIQDNLRPFFKSLVSMWKTHIKGRNQVQEFITMLTA